MKKTSFTYRARSVAAILAGGMVLTSCSTDNDIDLNDIDTHIGLGSDGFTFPSSSTNNIKLADVLELKENGVIKTTASGDYYFQKSDDLTASNPSVCQKLTVENTPASSFSGIPIDPSQTQPYRVPAAPQPIRSFTVDVAKSDQIIDLNFADLNGLVTIGLRTTDLNYYISQLDIDVYIPRFFGIDETGLDIDKTSATDYYIIKLKNITTSRDFSMSLPLKRLSKYDTSSTEVYARVEGDRIKMFGDVKMQLLLDRQYMKVSTPQWANLAINQIDFGQQIVVTHAEGYFNPNIDPQTSSVDISNDIPDFLKDDEVKILLDNPIIAVNIASNINLRGFVNGELTARYDDGSTKVMKLSKTQSGGQIVLNEHTGDVSSSTTTKIVICRRAGNEAGVQYVVKDGTQPLEAGETENDVTNILQKIPEKLDFTFNTRADVNYLGKIDLYDESTNSAHGRSYRLSPSYDFQADLTMNAGSSIVYNDTINDWHKDLAKDDIDLQSGTELIVTATVNNQTPMKLYLTPDAIGVPDANGNFQKLSNIDVLFTTPTMDAQGCYVPSNLGTSATSTIRIVMRAKTAGAFKQLDGLLLKVKAVTEQGGVTLNSQTQTVRAYDMKIQMNGRITLDLDSK